MTVMKSLEDIIRSHGVLRMVIVLLKIVLYSLLSRIKTAEYAVFNNFRSGPSFGENDLYIWPSLSNLFSGNSVLSYEKRIRETGNGYLMEGLVEECEVFQII